MEIRKELLGAEDKKIEVLHNVDNNKMKVKVEMTQEELNKFTEEYRVSLGKESTTQEVFTNVEEAASQLLIHNKIKEAVALVVSEYGVKLVDVVKCVMYNAEEAYVSFVIYVYPTKFTPGHKDAVHIVLEDVVFEGKLLEGSTRAEVLNHMFDIMLGSNREPGCSRAEFLIKTDEEILLIEDYAVFGEERFQGIFESISRNLDLAKVANETSEFLLTVAAHYGLTPLSNTIDIIKAGECKDVSIYRAWQEHKCKESTDLASFIEASTNSPDEEVKSEAFIKWAVEHEATRMSIVMIAAMIEAEYVKDTPTDEEVDIAIRDMIKAETPGKVTDEDVNNTVERIKKDGNYESIARVAKKSISDNELAKILDTEIDRRNLVAMSDVN